MPDSEIASESCESTEEPVAKSVKEQIQSGLRLGAGLGAFLISGFVVSDARSRIQLLSSYHHKGWTDWVVWLELVIITVLLLSSVHVWFQWLAGCSVFGILKGLVGLFVGRDLLPLQQVPSTRIISLILTVYCIATLTLLVRFRKGKFSVTDRIAVTLFFLCLLLPDSSFPSIWQLAGISILFVPWLVHWCGHDLASE